MKPVHVVKASLVVAGFVLLAGALPASAQRTGDGGKDAKKGDLAVESLALVPLSTNTAVRVTVKNVNYDDESWKTKPPVIRVSCVSPDKGNVTRVGKVRPIRPNGREELFFTSKMSETVLDPPSLDELVTGNPPEEAGILMSHVAWQCTAELTSPDDNSSNNRAKGGQGASYDMKITKLEFDNSGSSPPTAVVKVLLEGWALPRKAQLVCSKSGEPTRKDEKEVNWNGSLTQGWKASVTFGKSGAGFVPSAAGWQCTAQITGSKGADTDPGNDVFTAPVP